MKSVLSRLRGHYRSIPLLTVLAVLSACNSGKPPTHSWRQDVRGSLHADLSADGRWLAAATIEQGTGLWDLTKDAQVFKWQHVDDAPDYIGHVAIARDASHAVTTDKRTYVVWSVRSGKGLGYWQVDSDITAVAISDKGQHVLLGLEDGRAMHINQRTQRRLEVIAHRGEAVSAVALSADGKRAATAGLDRHAVLWETRTGKELMRHEHDSRVLITAVDPKGEMLFSADNKGGAKLGKQGASKKVKLELASRQFVVSAARFSNDGRYLLTGFPGGEVRLWDAYTGQALDRFQVRKGLSWQPRGNVIHALAFGGDSKSIIAQGSNGNAHRWTSKLAAR